MSLPSDAPIWRAVTCPVCTRYIGATDQETGHVRMYCKGCRAYHVIDCADPCAPRRDADKPVRLLTKDDE